MRISDWSSDVCSSDLAAGFESFNLDLIYGGAGETLDDWRATLEDVVALDPPHVSAYALTVEAGTPLADDPARHPDDDDQADKYLLATEVLGAAGLDSYAISNWSKHGPQSRTHPRTDRRRVGKEGVNTRRK